MNTSNRLLLAVISAAAIVAQGAIADTVGYTEAGTRADLANYGGAAFDFTVASTISVTQLGFYAISIGGGDTPNVSLWDVTTNTLLANTGTLTGITPDAWNYKTLTSPVTLTPGDTYQVSAPVYWAQTYSDSSSFSYGSDITPVGFFNSGSGFTGWTQSAPYTNPVISNVPAVADFQYTVSAVPEPSTVAAGILTAAGLLVSGIRSRSKRQS